VKYSSTQLVGQIAIESGEAAKVLDDFGIDYAAKGHMTLWAACSESGAEVPEVLRALEKSAGTTSIPTPGEVSIPPEKTSKVVHRIVRFHHGFTRTQLELVERLINAAVNQGIPRYGQLKAVFQRFSEAFQSHMRWEESVVFPYLVQADEAIQSGTPIPKLFEDPNYATNPLRKVLVEHRMMEKEFVELMDLASDLPKNDPLYKALQELGQDNREHIRLEGGILLRRAVQQGLMS
jgi:iron-sulfur cluster repair protein YtfE (RIC family)